MFPAEAYRSTLLKIVDVLNESDVRFHLTGGIVSAIYGEPRYTQDVDIVADQTALQTELPSFLNATRARGFTFHEQGVLEAIRDGRLFQILDSEEILKIDIYPRQLVDGELDRSRLAEVLQGVELPVVSRADLVVAKLIWIQKGRHKSRTDVRQLLSRATGEEKSFVQKVAENLSLTPLLAEVLSERDELLE